jgi:hypothetical protein
MIEGRRELSSSFTLRDHFGRIHRKETTGVQGNRWREMLLEMISNGGFGCRKVNMIRLFGRRR